MDKTFADWVWLRLYFGELCLVFSGWYDEKMTNNPNFFCRLSGSIAQFLAWNLTVSPPTAKESSIEVAATSTQIFATKLQSGLEQKVFTLGRAKIFGATCLTQDSIRMVRSTCGSSFIRLAWKLIQSQLFELDWFKMVTPVVVEV